MRGAAGSLASFGAAHTSVAATGELCKAADAYCQDVPVPSALKRTRATAIRAEDVLRWRNLEQTYELRCPPLAPFFRQRR
jgi:hypothetical protein